MTIVIGEHGRDGVLDNKYDPEGVSVTLTKGFENPEKSFCANVRQAANLAYPEPTAELTSNCWLWSEAGVHIKEYSELVADGKYYTFPAHRPFVWPTVKLGHKVKVPFGKNDVRYNPSSDDSIILETISISPRVFRLHNFVTADETDAMMARAKKLGLERSTGGLQKQGKEGENQGEYISDRTSTNAWDVSSPLAIKIKQRSFEALRMVYIDDWSDGLQVVKYEPGQFYNSHTDWFNLDASPNWNWDPARNGTNRFATVFLYLNDVELGGETVFPNSDTAMDKNTYRDEDFEKISNELLKNDKTAMKLARTCRNSFRVSPKKGDAILFYNQMPAGTPETAALHGACPVIEGEKWGANLWIWNAQCWTPEREPGYFDNTKEKPDARKGSFTNEADEPVDVYWAPKDITDDWVSLGEIDKGDVYHTNSYINHLFVFCKKGTKTEIARYKMTKDTTPQVFTIQVGKGTQTKKEEL